jgi:hypothetical protein
MFVFVLLLLLSEVQSVLDDNNNRQRQRQQLIPYAPAEHRWRQLYWPVPQGALLCSSQSCGFSPPLNILQLAAAPVSCNISTVHDLPRISAADYFPLI